MYTGKQIYEKLPTLYKELGNLKSDVILCQNREYVVPLIEKRIQEVECQIKELEEMDCK